MMRYLPSLLPFLVACGQAPYPEYWPDMDSSPRIDAVTPSELSHYAGGEELVIEGANLSEAQTVVIGDRNATIIEATDTTITVIAPSQVAGDSHKVVGVVTPSGLARNAAALSYTTPISAWSADEIASASLVTMDCPVESWALWGDDYYPIYWCGVEMGYAWGEAIVGTGPQAGFAGDMSGLAPLSALVPVGESRFWNLSTSPPLALPSRYANGPVDDQITVRTPRNFNTDLAFIDERLDLLADYYSWYDSVESTYPFVTVFDDETCWIGDLGILSNSDTEITLDADASGTLGIWMGMTVEELYDGEIYVSQGVTSSAMVTTNGDTLQSEWSGVDLVYDDYSGRFFGAGVLDTVGVADLPYSASYSVGRVRGDSSDSLGEVVGVQRLELQSPELLSGLTQLSRAQPFTLSWTPGTVSDDPSVVVVEVRVVDYDVDHPTGYHEVAGLVAQANDSTGSLTLTRDELEQLPRAANRINDNDDLSGMWGEITISRHQMRKVRYIGGDLVIDFVHAINTPIDIIE